MRGSFDDMEHRIPRAGRTALLVAAFALLVLFGGPVIVPGRAYFDLPILMYHDVAEPGTEPGLYAVSVEKLRSDIEWLLANGYTGVTARDLVAYLDDGVPLPEKPVMITFDDGYLSNYTYAYPLLREYGFKATFCVVGSTAGTTPATADGVGRPHFSWGQASEMLQSGVIDIQAHTWDLHHDGEYSYFMKSKLPYYRGIMRIPGEYHCDYVTRLRADLAAVKEKIDGEAGGKLLLLAYPYGYYDPWVRPILHELGIRATLLTRNTFGRVSGSLYSLTRKEVKESYDLAELFA